MVAKLVGDSIRTPEIRVIVSGGSDLAVFVGNGSHDAAGAVPGIGLSERAYGLGDAGGKGVAASGGKGAVVIGGLTAVHVRGDLRGTGVVIG